MTRFLRLLLFAWLATTPLLVIRLVAVRNSGIFLPTLGLSLLLALTGVQLVRSPALLPWRSRLTVPLLALALTAVLAGLQGALFYDRSVFGEHRYALVQIYAVALTLLSIGAAFAVAALLRTADDLRWLRLILVGVALLLLLDDRVVDLPIWKARWWPLIAAHAMSLVLAAVLLERQWWPLRLAGALFVLQVIYDIIVGPFFGNVRSQWISGWVAVAVPPALLILCRFPRTTVALAVPAIGLVAGLNWHLVERVVHLSYAEGDFLRFRLWEDALAMSLQRPMFGIGPGNYLDYIMRYGQIGAIMSSPHGNYQQVAAEMGLVGLGFLLWLAYRSLTLGWRIYRTAADPFLRSFALAGACSLAGQFAAAFLGDFLLPSYHNGGYWTIAATVYGFVVMGALMSAERLCRDRVAANGSGAQAAANAERRDQGDEARRQPLEG